MGGGRRTGGPRLGAATRRINAEDTRLDRRENLQRAIEAQLAVASAAWSEVEREREYELELRDGKHDRTKRRVIRRPRPHGRGEPAGTGLEEWEVLEEETERPHHVSQTARLLAVAHAAQARIAQLQGLFEPLPADPTAVHVTLTRQLDAPATGPVGIEPAPSAGEEERRQRTRAGSAGLPQPTCPSAPPLPSLSRRGEGTRPAAEDTLSFRH